MERWTVDEAQVVLDRWHASGKSARAYGREHGIDPQRLCFWHRKLRKGTRRGRKRPGRAIARLVPAVVRVEHGPGGEHAVVVRLPDGVSIEVDAAHVLAEWVAALVGELGRR